MGVRRTLRFDASNEQCGAGIARRSGCFWGAAKHRRDACGTTSLILNLFAFFPFSLFPLIFFTPLTGFLAAEFPDDAALAEFAV
jgi:hypothetical protein